MKIASKTIFFLRALRAFTVKSFLPKLLLYQLFAIAVLMLLVLSCSQKFPNPISQTFNGDYKLSASFSPLQDTFLLFQPYTINYKSTGKDSFSSYKIATDPPGSIDTALFHKSLNDSSMIAYFTAPMSGKIKIIGVHPNKKETDTVLPVIVKNPFRLQGAATAIAGKTITLFITAAVGSSFQAQWYVNNELTVEHPANSLFAYKSDTACTKTIYAIVKDTLGHSISTDTVTLSVNSRTPVVKFFQDSIEVPVGQETGINIQSSDCDSIRWTVKHLGLQTTTAGPLKVTFPTAIRDTVIAAGFSKFGVSSKPDTLVVQAIVFNYSLQAVQGQFPDTIRARHWASWRVQAMKNGAPVTGMQINYEWETTPDSLWDSLELSSDGSQLKLFKADSASFQLSVQAKVGTDSTYHLQQLVVIRAFKPYCSFVTGDLSAQINQDVALTVKAEDSNADGKIAGIHYMTSDNTSPVSTNDLDKWTVKFTTPGEKSVKAFAIDNDGFSSDTAALKITVTAHKPYFIRPTIDTSTFINDSFSLVAKAMAGNATDSITSYQWDFNGDGVWDRTTIVNRIDTVFTKAKNDTIKVGCSNSRGDTAETLAVIVVHVLEGTPKVKTVVCDPLLSYIGGQVALRITASDTNGTVKKLAIKINGGPDSIFAVKAAQSIDTSFKFTMPDTGKYIFSAAVIDDDSVKSAYVLIADSLVVTKGNPVVKEIKPETTYIFDTTQYSISASDINGTVTKYFVKWDSTGTFEQYSDSLVNHSFTDSRVHKISVYVQDNENNTSDTVSDSVDVLLGKPMVTSITVDRPLNAIYIKDTVKYTITGHDENDYIDSVMISWDGDTIYDFKAKLEDKKESITAAHTFARSDSGVKQVLVRVMDPDGLSKDTVFTINVLSGAPVIDSLKPRTTWINDDSTYTIVAHDKNGMLKKYFYDLDNDNVWDDSADVNSFKTHFTSFGNKTTRIGVRDEDSVLTIATYQINIRLGMPRVWNQQGGDTMFIVSQEGGGNVKLRVSSFDTNGTINKYFWDYNSFNGFDTLNPSNQGDTSHVDSITKPIGPGDVNHGYRMAVFGRDDDGFVAGDTFFLLPDAPPPTATTTTTSQPGMPDVRLAWFGLDSRDDSLTQFAVVVGKDTDSVTDTVVNFTEAKSSVFGKTLSIPSYITFTFNPKNYGINKGFYFKVIARDKRGSKPAIINTANVMYPY